MKTVRTLALIFALAGCTSDNSNAPEIGTSPLPGRQGEPGEAGPPGPRGEKGESGVLAATELIANATALPESATFASQGGRLVITASGSGFRGATAGTIGMALAIDSVPIANVTGYTNETGSHKAFVPRQLVVSNITAGQHTLTLTALADTSTDQNDYFNVTILELR